ncbi:hypothetical protein [Haloarcula rubripromontorii]|uniref:hypothetical protein n=1 Tax=Haloarcula rubripromontorii TaxID=1705562 RepID=UPI00345BE0FF
MDTGDHSGRRPRAGSPPFAGLAGRLGMRSDRSTETPTWGPLTWFAVAVVAVELVGLQSTAFSLARC